MGVTEEAGKVATSVVDVMKGAPTILALLVVNIGFIIFITYTLTQVATRTGDLHREQSALIVSLIKDVRDCYIGKASPASRSILFK